MLTLLPNLMAHAEWANAVFFHVWGKSPARDHEEMRGRVEHIVYVQESFLTVLQGGSPERPPAGSLATFGDLQARAKTCHAGLRSFAAALDDDTLSRTVTVPWFPTPCVITTGDAMIQVAMHTQHHRGQCITRLRELGGEPKNVDWIIWLWKQKPEARWG